MYAPDDTAALSLALPAPPVAKAFFTSARSTSSFLFGVEDIFGTIVGCALHEHYGGI